MMGTPPLRAGEPHEPSLFWCSSRYLTPRCSAASRSAEGMGCGAGGRCWGSGSSRGLSSATVTPASPTTMKMTKARRSAMFMAKSRIDLLSQARMVCSSHSSGHADNLRFRRQNFVSFRQALHDFGFVPGHQTGLHGLLLRLVSRQIDVRGLGVCVFEHGGGRD